MDTPHVNRERARLAIKLRAAADWLDNGGPSAYDMTEAHALVLQVERGLTQLRSEATEDIPITRVPRSDRGEVEQPAIKGTDMYLGDRVYTFRHGAGQPSIEGTLVDVQRDIAIIRTDDGKTRKRTVTMLRKVQPLEGTKA